MKIYHDNYGIDSDDLDGVAKVISERLDIPLEADSDFDYGGKYYEYRSEQEGNVKLFLNWDAADGEWVEWRLRGHPMVLQVFEAPRNFKIEQALQTVEEFTIKLLRRSVFDTETKDYKVLFSLVDQRQDTG